MVVLLVASNHETTMRRSTEFSAFFRTLRAGTFGALALAAFWSCSSDYATSLAPAPDGVIRVKVGSVEVVVPDSVKQALAAQGSANSVVPISMSANVLSPLSSAASLAAASSCGGSGATPGYTLSKGNVTPDAIPNIAPYPITEDGWIPDSFVPLGFDFNFYGNTYNKVNVYSNGFLLFGPTPPKSASGFAPGGWIPNTANPKNIIAFAWTDWSPQLVQDGIRWETRGTAPKRRFIVQFNNVPEYYSASRLGSIVQNAGRLMTQVVLYEGSNEITIYTNSMTVTNSSHWVTQAIEDPSGTQWVADSVRNDALARTFARIHYFFNLSNDGVRFTPLSTKDEVAPSITAPANVTQGNDLGLASAVVAVGSPVASDNCSDVKISSARSDGKLIDAPYPVGVTTVTWTATDASGNSASASQSITVLDTEAPVFAPNAEAVLEVNATSLNGAPVTFSLRVTDNVGVTSVSCNPTSGSVFPVGTTHVTCTASDAAGNSASLSFDVSVIGAHEQIDHLMNDVIPDLGLPNGTLQPLLNQLKLAYTQTADGGSACTKVGDFLSLVQKKSSNISPADVTLLTDAATTIMNAMDCAPPARGSVSPSVSYFRSPTP